MKKLVFTVTCGEEFTRMADELTVWRMRDYARRIGADFLQMHGEGDYESPFFRRLDMCRLLASWDRVLYLDADVIVREGSPDIFEAVPRGKIGMYDESILMQRNATRPDRIGFIDLYNEQLESAGERPLMLEDWDGRYYNTGVIVADAVNRGFFMSKLHVKPVQALDWDQDYLNFVLFLEGAETHDIGYRFNAIHGWRGKEDDFDLSAANPANHFVHVAGSKQRKREALENTLRVMYGIEDAPEGAPAEEAEGGDCE
jgi:hypothetical protein